MSVGLDADEATSAWVIDQSKYFFNMHAVEPTGFTGWKVVAGGQLRLRVPDFTKHDTRLDTGERVRYGFSPTTKTLVVEHPPGPWRRLYALRAIRHLMRWQLQSHGALFLHGAGLAVGSEAIALLGRPGSGKSVLSVKLAHRGWSILSQDDLCLLPEGDGWSVMRWPGSVRLRRTAAAIVPDVFASKDLRHPGNALEAGLDMESARLRVFLSEIRLLTSSPPPVPGKLKVLVFLDPRLDPGNRQPVLSVEAWKLLIEAWDMLPERRAGARVRLTQPESWLSVVFNPFLLQAFGHPDVSSLSANLKRVATMVPAWRVGRGALLDLDTSAERVDIGRG